MADKKSSLAEKFSSLAFTLISLAVFAVGLVLFIVSNALSPSRENWQKMGSEIGSFLMASVALAFLWDAFGKRAFLTEVLEKTQMAAQLNLAGIRDYLPNYHLWNGWNGAFQSAHTLDIFAAYPVTWFRSYRSHLQEFVRKGKTIRVILADPDASETVGELAQRFGKTPDYVRTQIMESHREFKSLSTHPGKVEVRKSSGGHPVKLLLFDNVCLLVTYSLRPETEAPALVANKDGQLYEYVRQEFKAAWAVAQSSGATAERSDD